MTTNPQARLSIVAYKPKPGKDADLLSLTKEHVPLLRRLGMATERPAIIATAQDGVVVEAFEWTEGGLDRAHAHPAVSELWIRFAAACDYVPLNTLPETAMTFANFTPMD